MGQCTPQFPDGEIERAGMEQGPDILGGRRDARAGGMQQAHDLGMGDDDALGGAGGTGGVDEVGRMLRQQIGALWCVSGVLCPGVGIRVDPEEGDVVALLPCVRQRMLGDEHARLRIVEHEGQSLGGIGRVQRQIGGASLEHGEDGDDHLHAAVQEQCDAIFRADAVRDQVMGELVGAGIEVGIAQRALAIDHGDGLRGACDLLLEHAGQTALVGEDAMLAGEALQPLLALGGVEERQALHAAVFVGDHAVQHGEEVVQMALDGAALEQCGGIAERTDDAAVVRFQGELQIEFG